MKNLIFERSVGASAERVGMRLYQVTSGFIAERFLVQGDQTTLVQVLPMSTRSEFDGFALADPHYSAMRMIYGEVRRLVWGNEAAHAE
ncbi:hypothetical protein [Burkholderia singularis]|nr:hypothetical protein [Burkholderia singularis]